MFVSTIRSFEITTLIQVHLINNRDMQRTMQSLLHLTTETNTEMLREFPCKEHKTIRKFAAGSSHNQLRLSNACFD